jgi:tellurite resistance protein
MTSATQKLQILESLNALDQYQANQVLAFINGIMNNTEEAQYKRFKREAMREIRQAINRERILTKVSA